MATRQWWERPRLWGAEATAEERRVSWLELFSDLIFVVVISQLAHYLAGHLSWSGLLGYGLFFVAAWWSWIGGTVYNERFETQDLSYRLYTIPATLARRARRTVVHFSDRSRWAELIIDSISRLRNLPAPAT